MQPATLPANETERLARLHGLGVLDTLPDRAYDDITALARNICDTPIALISLVDENRQWFKSGIGLDFSENPRDMSFCAHSLHAPQEVMVVEDALADDRFKDNPLVTGAPNIRFYAGAPIVTDDGFVIGTVCVIDHEPRRISAPQRDALQRLAGLVITLMSHEKARRSEQAAQMQAWRQHDTDTLKHNEAQLAKTVEQLERKTLELQRFIRMLSHDLREPVNSINNFSRLLAEDHQPILPPTAQRYLGFVRNSGRRLGTLIDDMIEFAALDNHVVHLETLDLQQLARQLQSDMIPELTASGGRISTGALPLVHSDVDLMRTLLHHLLSNALKFARPGVPPEVRIDAVCTEHSIEVRVHDNGVGIPAQHQDNIFGMFRRLHNRRQYEGTGLGLSICQRAADLLHAQLTLRSTPGQGSVFSLHLPVAAQAAQRDEP